MPFPVQLSLPSGDSYSFTIEVEIEGQESMWEPASCVLAIFASLAGWGAFAAERTSPVLSKLQLGKPVLTRGRRRYDGEAKGIHAGAWRVLLNALVQSHYEVPLKKFSLEIPSGSQHSDRDIAWVPFPSPIQPPFAVSQEVALDEATDPVLRMYFRQRLGEAPVQQLTSLFADWDRLVQMGGYQQTLEPPESLYAEVGATYLVGPSTIEHVCYGLAPPPEAFVAAVNIVHCAHTRIGPLHELVIE